jgi:RsiW-degrading membrane proteinase PrsW (M82 family)
MFCNNGSNAVIFLFLLKGGALMRVLWLLLVSLLPGILWVYFFYRKDRYEPEPARLIVKAFIYGALAVIPVGIIELPFADQITGGNNLVRLLLLSILVIGLTEEFFKLFVVAYGFYNLDEFNEVVDGIIYSISAGLGFAVVENLLYTVVFGYQVGMVRALITTLVHASFSGIAGYYLGLAKMKKGSEVLLILGGLVQVVILHGIYDFLIVGNLISMGGVFVVVTGLYIYLIRLIKKANALSPFKP